MKWVLWMALGIPAVIGMIILFWFDPAQNGFYPVCLFHQVTGYDCPGCGGLRASHQLLRGNVIEAFRLNPLVVMALPIIVALVLRSQFTSSKARPGRTRCTLLLAWGLVVLFVGFAVLRNLPFWPLGQTGF
jgi:hypothetical protein